LDSSVSGKLTSAERLRQNVEKPLSQATTPSAAETSLQLELEAEYERGRTETAQLARERMDQIKLTAKTRITDLQSRLDAETTKHTEDINKAREIVSRLKEELRKTQEELTKAVEEKDILVAKSRLYVQQVRESKQEEQVKLVKASMEKVYTKLGAELGANEIYDGKHVLNLVRNAIKESLKDNGIA